METDKLFELMTKMYGEMQEGLKRVENEIKDKKEGVINIENNHGKKLDMLIDVYKQNTEQLHRIEKQIFKHYEFTLSELN